MKWSSEELQYIIIRREVPVEYVPPRRTPPRRRRIGQRLAGNVDEAPATRANHKSKRTRTKAKPTDSSGTLRSGKDLDASTTPEQTQKPILEGSMTRDLVEAPKDMHSVGLEETDMDRGWVERQQQFSAGISKTYEDGGDDKGKTVNSMDTNRQVDTMKSNPRTIRTAAGYFHRITEDGISEDQSAPRLEPQNFPLEQLTADSKRSRARHGSIDLEAQAGAVVTPPLKRRLRSAHKTGQSSIQSVYIDPHGQANVENASPPRKKVKVKVNHKTRQQLGQTNSINERTDRLYAAQKTSVVQPNVESSTRSSLHKFTSLTDNMEIESPTINVGESQSQPAIDTRVVSDQVLGVLPDAGIAHTYRGRSLAEPLYTLDSSEED